MYQFKEYEGNALAITDAQVAADWRLGIVRAIACKIRNSGIATNDTNDFTVTAGSAITAHIHGNRMNPGKCAIVEVYEVDDVQETEWVRNYDDSYPESNTVLRGKVTCACGQVEKSDFKVVTYGGGLLKSIATVS